MYERLGVTIDQHHNAGDDALAAARVTIRLAETVGLSAVRDLDAVAQTATVRRYAADAVNGG